MGRKQLTGVSLPDNWTSLGGAIEGVLRALGDSAGSAMIMGLTGFAFRLALPVADAQGGMTSGAHASTGNKTEEHGGEPSPRKVAAGGGQAAFAPDEVVRALRRLGYKAEVHFTERADRDFARRRARAIKAAQKRIDRGTPAIAFDLHLPRFGLVTGYDDGAGLWFVQSMLSGQTGGRLPVDRWPVPEGDQPLFVVFITGKTKFEPARAVAEVIRESVSAYEHGSAAPGAGYVTGRPALLCWAEAFSGDVSVDAHGNAMLVQVLQSARRDAIAFLRDGACRWLPVGQDAFQAAADAYTRELHALSRLTTMFPFPSGGNPASPASRVVATAALREVLEREDAAISVLKKALPG